MQPADASRFRDLLRGVGRVFGNEPDAVVLDAYWLALKDWDLEHFEHACGHLLKTAKFMPRPFDFTELRKAGRMKAGEAWTLVRAAARSGDPCPDHPAIRAAVNALGGIRSIGMTNTDQMQFLERRFAEHYESINDAEDVREAVPEIAGPMRHLNRPRSITELLTRQP